MGIHPEHVRFLVRQGRLQASKENGEIRITLPDLMNFMNMTTKVRLMNAYPIREAILEDSLVLWPRPEEEAAD